MTVMTAAATTTMVIIKLSKWKKQHHQPFHLPWYATIREVPVAFPSPPEVPMIALTFSEMLKSVF
eukprot:12811962-Ditylum_brightwellii.AAC.1